jgi:hypothetical protein
VLFPDAAIVLDTTRGKGRFWDGSVPVSATDLDISPYGNPHVVGNFTSLGFPDGSFDVCVFDPPYLADVSRSNSGVVGRRFGSFATLADVQRAVEAGCREAWRVSRLGVIVKARQHIHESRFVDMVGWMRGAVPAPIFGQVEQVRPIKLTDPKWRDQLSVWSNSATFLAFRHGDQRHVGRSRREARPA